MFTKKEVKMVLLDDKLIWKLKCPICGIWAYIDEDQFHGKVSIQCQNEVKGRHCTFHETHDLSQLIDKVEYV